MSERISDCEIGESDICDSSFLGSDTDVVPDDERFIEYDIYRTKYIGDTFLCGESDSETSDTGSCEESRRIIAERHEEEDKSYCPDHHYRKF